MKNKKNIKKNEKRIAENNRIIKDLELRRKRAERMRKLIRGMIKNIPKSIISAALMPVTLMAIRKFRKKYSQQPEGN